MITSQCLHVCTALQVLRGTTDVQADLDEMKAEAVQEEAEPKVCFTQYIVLLVDVWRTTLILLVDIGNTTNSTSGRYRTYYTLYF